jgi:hypothetical protein
MAISKHGWNTVFPIKQRTLNMNSYNIMITSSIASYKRRKLELVSQAPGGKNSRLYIEASDMSMSLVDGDFAEVVASAPGFSLLVERVCSHGGVAQEQGVTLVTDFIASCIGLSSEPAEWVALGLDRACEGLGDDERYVSFRAALELVQVVVDYMIADCSDEYSFSLECHLPFKVDEALGCGVERAVA